MTEVVIVDAVRTPMGRSKNGVFRNVSVLEGGLEWSSKGFCQCRNADVQAAGRFGLLARRSKMGRQIAGSGGPV